ncbi:DUF1573 domain-containing protein [Candidatus Berkelbacteria bacterium]|nr:DUF1573 domain-containing protein [Candidatus Berkelbacteria bacterium]
MDKTVWIILGLTGVLLAGLVLIASKTPSMSSAYSADDPNRPILVASETNFNFGKMRTDEERTATTTLRNDGKAPLEIKEVTTSCDCTFAKLTLADGTASPEFSMHGKTTWTGKIAPGESATAELIYRPSVMPVKGKVERSALIHTDDPVTPSLQLAFSAEVE